MCAKTLIFFPQDAGRILLSMQGQLGLKEITSWALIQDSVFCPDGGLSNAPDRYLNTFMSAELHNSKTKVKYTF